MLKKNLKYFVLIYIALFGLTKLSYPQVEHSIHFPSVYRFAPGDDLNRADPKFTDDDWIEFSLNNFPYELWDGIGWFRFALKVDSSLWNKQLGISLKQVGAVQVFMDGNLIYQYGKVGTSIEDEQPRFVDYYPPPEVLIFKPKETDVNGKASYLFAVRYSSFLLESPFTLGVKPSLNINIDDFSNMRTERRSIGSTAKGYQMLFAGIFFTIAFIHLLMFLFYRKFKANLYFAIVIASAGFLAIFKFNSLIISDFSSYMWNSRFFDIFGIVISLSALRLTYHLIYKNLPKQFTFLLAIGITLSIIHFILPVLLWSFLWIFTLLVLLEVARVIIFSRIKKVELRYKGGWLILLSFIPIVVAGSLQFLTWLEIIPKLWDFIEFPSAYYAVLLLGFSMSVFLSKNFAETNKNLEKQLEQVKLLSEKTLQQEIEKAKLEAENERKSRELEEACKLQLSMLPQKIPQLPQLDISVFMNTATEVGGDYYDFLIDDETLTVAIGDATGHGLQAGTMVAASKSLFISNSKLQPKKILSESSSSLKSMGFKLLFMAMAAAKIKNHKFIISNAGMPFPLVYRNDSSSVEEINIKGMPLGSFTSFPYKQIETELKSGDVILFMSDGFPELFNDKKEMLGYNKAIEIFKKSASKSSKEIIDELVSASKKWANGYPQQDDITFVVIKIR